jgi:NAD(P)H-flavin reductase
MNYWKNWHQKKVMKDTNIYKPLRAKLVEVIEESPTIKSFVLEPEREFSFATGQFIELTLNGTGEAPFTPSSSPLVKDRIEITIMKAGYVTEKIHALKPGEIMGIRGPYGRGYPLDELYGKEILVVAGDAALHRSVHCSTTLKPTRIR